jgi:hypothetical protein
MLPRDEIGSPQQNVTFALRQHDQIVLLDQPQAYPRLAPSIILPDAQSGIVVILDDRSWPSDALAASDIGHAIRFSLAFRDQVPKGSLFAVDDRVPFQSEPCALEVWAALNEIGPEV